jgi:hypothetical protein
MEDRRIEWPEKLRAMGSTGKEAMRMKKPGFARWMAAAALLMATQAFSQGDLHAGRGQAVVTVMPRHHSELVPNLSQQDLNVKVNGKEAKATGWLPLRGADDGLELVLVIDNSARDLSRQFGDIRSFLQTLPPHTRAAIGYMQNGRVALAGPFSTDRAVVLGGLHLPSGIRGLNGSPYFCLSDLAKNWPSNERGMRREAVLVTDGVEPYSEHYDPDNTYVQAAITDSVRAGLVVYSIYWTRWNNASSFSAATDGGQNYLSELTQATGGSSYGFGSGNPVSFQSYFEDIARRLENQYRLSFTARLDGKPAVGSLKLKNGGMAADVTAPGQVFVERAAAVQ